MRDEELEEGRERSGGGSRVSPTDRDDRPPYGRHIGDAHRAQSLAS